MVILAGAQAYAKQGPISFIYMDRDGNVIAFQKVQRGWTEVQLNNGGKTTAPPATSLPAAFTITHEQLGRQTDVCYVDAEGKIQHLYANRTTHGKWVAECLNVDGVTDAPPAVGRVSSTPYQDAQLEYVYRDKDGRLNEIAWRDSRWSVQRLNVDGATTAPPAAGDPCVMEWGEKDEPRCMSVTFRDGDGGIQHLCLQDGKWICEKLNLGEGTDGPAAKGGPVSIYCKGEMHHVYQDGDGMLHHVWRTQGQKKWNWEQLNEGGRTSAPKAVGAPVSLMREGLPLNFLYRDGEGTLQSIYWSEGWKNEALTGPSGRIKAPAAVSDPSVCLISPEVPAEGGQLQRAPEEQYVFYVDEENRLQQLREVGGQWEVETVNQEENARMALPIGGLSFF
jgi:hypothetical protein